MVSQSPVRRLVLAGILGVASACASEPSAPSSDRPIHVQCAPTPCSFITTIAGPSRAFVSANTTGHVTTFNVKNVGTLAGTTSISCTPGSHISCVSVSTPSIHLNPGENEDFTVTWNAGAVIPNTTAGATDAAGGGANYQKVTIQ